MLLDKQILNAMKNAVDEAGSQSELARRAGIGKQHISKYLRGDVRNIEYETWVKLLPHLLPYLPADENLISDSGENKWSLRKSTIAGTRPVPVVTQSSAAGFDPMIESFYTYMMHTEHDKAPFLMEQEGLIGILTEEDPESIFQPGTLIILDSMGYPKNGSRVAARPKDEDRVIFRMFEHTENGWTLSTENGKGKNYFWKGPADNPFAWIYPLLYSFNDERFSQPRSKNK